jgi:exodeoxyribonuclease VII large subunit
MPFRASLGDRKVDEPHDVTAVSKTYLVTTYQQRAEVKALGARWDSEVSRWFVPEGKDLAPFAAWLPKGQVEESTSMAVDTLVKGVSLSRLLSGVAAAVSQAFREGVWTTAEVVKATNRGHYYLELCERDSEGGLVAQARGVIWARTAERLVADFKRATGADLDAGIKVLIRAKPVFAAKFGFSLEIDDIDPAYTLGDLEARRREIRARLKKEGLFERNRRLPAPWDFQSVLVIAPQQGAGLGDFAKEAQRLQQHGVCDFSYMNSRFQGEGAALEVVDAIGRSLSSWSGAQLPDAVAVLRGGGSVTDLAWLEDYALARCICECPVPVLTGIGHERDTTVLDEVAHMRYDTPSKVILGIEQVIARRTREAQASFSLVTTMAARIAERAGSAVDRLDSDVRSAAKATISDARSQTAAAMTDVRVESLGGLHRASANVDALQAEVRAGAKQHVGTAKSEVPAMLATVRLLAESSLDKARERIQGRLPTVLDRAQLDVRRARQGLAASVQEVLGGAGRVIEVGSVAVQALVREIAGQGPAKTLKRGFAVVRSTDGKTVTSAQGAAATGAIEVTFADGRVRATAHEVQQGEAPGAEPGAAPREINVGDE